MNCLSDELINKYIDKETSHVELNVINEHLAVCDECAVKIKAARLTENVLQRMSASAGISENFTDSVMAKIIKTEAKPAKPENNFIKIVFSSFILAIGAAVGYGLSLAAEGGESSSEPGAFDVIFNKTSEFFSGIRIPSEFKFFQNSEITGAVILITLLTVGYYLYESHRELKKRAGQLR